jgi:glycosyltransferase involved in cell wall biosynthesis
MIPINTFTFVIGYRHSIDRLNNLKRTLDWINGFSGSQVLLIEQDSHSKISHFNLRCEHIFVKSKMPYNRSWAFNIGMKYAKSNIVVCGDSDLIMRPEDFIQGLKLLDQYEMVSPYNSVVDLTPQENNLPIENIFQIERAGRGELDHQKINISGGIAMFRKDALRKIGGWSEDFIGWGGEDDFQTVKVENFLTHYENKAKCFHFHHGRSPINQQSYQQMLQMLQKMKSWTKDEMIRYINHTIPKNGMINKHDTF